MAEGDTNPFYVLVVAAVFVIVVIVAVYAVGIFINVMPNPFAAGSYGNAIYQNDSMGKMVYHAAFNTIETGILIVVLVALGIDAYISYSKPNGAMGLVNALLVFLLPIIWLAFKTGISQLSFLTANTGITPVSYSFFISTYFILVVESMVIVSAVLNFRHREATEVGSSGDSGMPHQDMTQYSTLGGSL